MNGCTTKDSSYCDTSTQCADPAQVCDVAANRCVPAPQEDAGRIDAPAQDAGADEGVPGDAAHSDRGPSDGGGDSAAGDDAGGDDAGIGDAGCQSPRRVCGTGCYELDDPAHCGANCDECTAPTNAHATCDGTSCGFECDSAYWWTGSSCDACSTTAHCGAACVECQVPQHGQATCSGTACGIACDATYWPNTTTCDPCDSAAHCGPTCDTCSGMTPVCQGGQSGKCVCNLTSCSGQTPVCDSGTGQCRACTDHPECASGICNGDGSCVSSDDIIYVNRVTCSESGSGTAALPFCSFSTALAAANAGPRYRIYVSYGIHTVYSAQEVAGKQIVIVGDPAAATTLRQSGSGLATFSVLTGGNVSFSRISFANNTGGTPAAVVCAGQSSTAMASLTIDRGEVMNNSAIGVSATWCNLTIRRSNVHNNSGLGVSATNSSVTLSQSKILTNNAGGLLVQSGNYDIENCLIARNGHVDGSGSDLGGASLWPGAGTNRFVNNTVVDNVMKLSATDGAEITCGSNDEIRNSVVYESAITATVYLVYGCTVTYSDVKSGDTSNGNIATDPLFVDPASSDYHLKTSPASPCINAGSSTNAPTVDLDNYPRSGNPDMGCYEAH